MDDILAALGSRVLVGDGAMGTALMERGLEAGECAELWNMDHADEIAAVLTGYRDAGADMLITATFGASRWKLASFGLQDRVREINAAAVDVARKAAAGRSYVLADVGPTGRFMEPLGADPRDAFVEIYREQVEVLAAAGADAVILETFTSLAEILAALEAALSTGLPVIASMSFARSASGEFRTMMGDELAASAHALEEAGASVIAANCGAGPADYVDITAALSAASSLPVMVQPNAGVPKLVGAETVFPMGPDEMAGFVEGILAAGARVVGGCCGTTAEHIEAIRREVDRLS